MDNPRHIGRVRRQIHPIGFKHAVNNGKKHKKPGKAQVFPAPEFRQAMPLAEMDRQIDAAGNLLGNQRVVINCREQIFGAEVGGLLVGDINKNFAEHSDQQKAQRFAAGLCPANQN